MQCPQQECLRSISRVSARESSLSVPGRDCHSVGCLPAASDQVLNAAVLTPRSLHLITDFPAFFILLVKQSLLCQKNSYSQRDQHASWLHKWHTLTCKYPRATWHTASQDSPNQLCHRIFQPLYNRPAQKHCPIFSFYSLCRHTGQRLYQCQLHRWIQEAECLYSNTGGIARNLWWLLENDVGTTRCNCRHDDKTGGEVQGKESLKQG